MSTIINIALTPKQRHELATTAQRLRVDISKHPLVIELCDSLIDANNIIDIIAKLANAGDLESIKAVAKPAEEHPLSEIVTTYDTSVLESVLIPKVKPIEYEFLRIQCVAQRNRYSEIRDRAALNGEHKTVVDNWQRSIDEVNRLEQFFAQLIEKCGGWYEN